MWKSKLLRCAGRLNASLRALGVVSSKAFRTPKSALKRLMVDYLAPQGILQAEVRGFTMYLPAHTSDGLAYVMKDWEPFTSELFEAAVKPGARVLDVGAQFGYFALMAARRVGPTGTVYAFEPAPDNFEILERNVRTNGHAGIIRPVMAALGEREASRDLFLYEDSNSYGLHPHPRANVKGTIPVPCLTADLFLGGRTVDVIKMDVEGHEPYVIEGMAETISRSGSLTLFSEFYPALLRRAGVEPSDYLARLRELGFSVELIEEDSRSLRPISRDFLLSADFPYANLHCRKGGETR